MKRRSFLTAATGALAACSKSARQERPNILFAIADDQSWPHAGAYGTKGVRTPHFDRVAGEGAVFTRAYSVCPSCTPSRSAVLTGRQMWRVEEAGVLYGTIPTKYPLSTHLLEDGGYFTGFTGKGWAPGDWRAAGLTRHPNGREFNTRRRAQPPPEGIDPRDYAANFEDFLAARPQGKPFSFWFGSAEPHRVYKKGLGLELGKKLEDAVVPPYWPDTPEIRSDILDYYAEIEWFDAQLGRMLASLEKRGELDRTLVIVTSDNGLPFPRAKVNLYDPGVHMPLAIRWPTRFQGSRKIEDFVSHIDFAPTLFEAAGIAAPPDMDGRSLLPLLDSKQRDPQRDCVFHGMERHTMCRPDGATYPMRAIRTERYHYIRNFQPDRWPTGGDFLSSNKTQHGDVDGCPTKDFLTDPANQRKYPREYGLCFGKRPAEEFYDMEKDPHELNNLAGATPPEMAAHRDRLEAYLRKTGDPRIEGRDPWQSYAYRQTTGYGASFNSSLPEAVREAARQGKPHKPE